MNTVTYTISMNWSLEIARALTGGIGIVLTIPITILFMDIFETLRRANNECCIYIGVIAPLSMIIFGGKKGFISILPIFKFRYFNY